LRLFHFGEEVLLEVVSEPGDLHRLAVGGEVIAGNELVVAGNLDGPDRRQKFRSDGRCLQHLDELLGDLANARIPLLLDKRVDILAGHPALEKLVLQFLGEAEKPSSNRHQHLLVFFLGHFGLPQPIPQSP